jgi:hypothetical protein
MPMLSGWIGVPLWKFVHARSSRMALAGSERQGATVRPALLLPTCRCLAVLRRARFSDVIGHIADHPIHQIDALLPWRWTK